MVASTLVGVGFSVSAALGDWGKPSAPWLLSPSANTEADSIRVHEVRHPAIGKLRTLVEQTTEHERVELPRCDLKQERVRIKCVKHGYGTRRLTYGSKLRVSFDSELASFVIMNANKLLNGRGQHWLDSCLGRVVAIQRFALRVPPRALSPLIARTNDRGIDVSDPPFLFAMY